MANRAAQYNASVENVNTFNRNFSCYHFHLIALA